MNDPTSETVPAQPQLPSELTIYTVGDHLPSWIDWLHRGPGAGTPGDRPAMTIDASTVTQIDAAGLQMLVSLSHSLTRQQCALRLEQPSEALTHGCRLLGMTDWLAHASTPEVSA